MSLFLIYYFKSLYFVSKLTVDIIAIPFSLNSAMDTKTFPQ